MQVSKRKRRRDIAKHEHNNQKKKGSQKEKNVYDAGENACDRGTFLVNKKAYGRSKLEPRTGQTRH